MQHSEKLLLRRLRFPAALRLNEASDLQQIMEGIRCGFSSVMIDGSSLPFDENVKLTKRLSKWHMQYVFIEAQSDKLPHAEDGFFLGRLKESI